MVTRVPLDGDGADAPAPAGPDPLAFIEAEGAALEAAAVPPDPNAPEPVDVRAEARELSALVLSIVLPILPDRYANRYGERQQRAIGDALGAWCEARGVSMGDMLGRWAPELALLAACIGPALPVIVQDVKRRAEPARPVTRPAPEPAP